jgi:hypothetical protein
MGNRRMRRVVVNSRAMSDSSCVKNGDVDRKNVITEKR